MAANVLGRADGRAPVSAKNTLIAKRAALQAKDDAARHHHGTLGMWSDIQAPGTIAVGDSVELVARR